MAWSSLGRRVVLRGLLVEAPEPTGGNRRSGDGSRGELRRRQVRAGGGDEAAGVGPGLDAPLAAGGDDAGCERLQCQLEMHRTQLNRQVFPQIRHRCRNTDSQSHAASKLQPGECYFVRTLFWIIVSLLSVAAIKW